ncbi:MAG: hypothetical protein AAB870_02980, partial [Patescibacteria group bacterium]
KPLSKPEKKKSSKAKHIISEPENSETILFRQTFETLGQEYPLVLTWLTDTGLLVLYSFIIDEWSPVGSMKDKGVLLQESIERCIGGKIKSTDAYYLGQQLQVIRKFLSADSIEKERRLRSISDNTAYLLLAALKKIQSGGKVIVSPGMFWDRVMCIAELIVKKQKQNTNAPSVEVSPVKEMPASSVNELQLDKNRLKETTIMLDDMVQSHKQWSQRALDAEEKNNQLTIEINALKQQNKRLSEENFLLKDAVGDTHDLMAKIQQARTLLIPDEDVMIVDGYTVRTRFTPHASPEIAMANSKVITDVLLKAYARRKEITH